MLFYGGNRRLLRPFNNHRRDSRQSADIKSSFPWRRDRSVELETGPADDFHGPAHRRRRTIMRQPTRLAMAGHTAPTHAIHASSVRSVGARQLATGASGVLAAGKRVLRPKGKPASRREAVEEGPSWKLIGLLVGAALVALIGAFLAIAYVRSGGSAAAACRQIGQKGLAHAVVCPAGLSKDDLATAGQNACDEPLGTPCMAYIWMAGVQAPTRLPVTAAQSAAVWAVWSNWDGVLRNCRKEAC
jgi:hypothetical protein